MRKNILVLALLFCGGFSLAAQSHPDVSIYVAPVTGRGGKSEENSLFYNQLIYELTDQKINMAKTQKGAEYSLIGRLSPYTGGAGQYVFHLELQNNKTREITVEGELLYETPDDTNQLFSVLVTSLLYTIPGDYIAVDNIPTEPNKDSDWRNNWLYLGLAAKWTPGVNVGTVGRSNFLGFQGGISAEFHFLNFLSFETGLEGGLNGVKIKSTTTGKETDYYDLLIEVPLLLKYVFKPGSNLMLEPYTGLYINFPLVKTINPPLLSFILGFQCGVKAGPGAVFLGLGGTMDIGNTTVRNVSNVSYHRYNIHLGLGYKYGLFQREIK